MISFLSLNLGVDLSEFTEGNPDFTTERLTKIIKGEFLGVSFSSKIHRGLKYQCNVFLENFRWRFRKNHYSKDFRYIFYSVSHFNAHASQDEAACYGTTEIFFYSVVETRHGMHIHFRDAGRSLC